MALPLPTSQVQKTSGGSCAWVRANLIPLLVGFSVSVAVHLFCVVTPHYLHGHAAFHLPSSLLLQHQDMALATQSRALRSELDTWLNLFSVKTLFSSDGTAYFSTLVLPIRFSDSGRDDLFTYSRSRGEATTYRMGDSHPTKFTAIQTSSSWDVIIPGQFTGTGLNALWLFSQDQCHSELWYIASGGDRYLKTTKAVTKTNCTPAKWFVSLLQDLPRDEWGHLRPHSSAYTDANVDVVFDDIAKQLKGRLKLEEMVQGWKELFTGSGDTVVDASIKHSRNDPWDVLTPLKACDAAPAAELAMYHKSSGRLQVWATDGAASTNLVLEEGVGVTWTHLVPGRWFSGGRMGLWLLSQEHGVGLLLKVNCERGAVEVTSSWTDWIVDNRRVWGGENLMAKPQTIPYQRLENIPPEFAAASVNVMDRLVTDETRNPLDTRAAPRQWDMCQHWRSLTARDSHVNESPQRVAIVVVMDAPTSLDLLRSNLASWRRFPPCDVNDGQPRPKLYISLPPLDGTSDWWTQRGEGETLAVISESEWNNCFDDVTVLNRAQNVAPFKPPSTQLLSAFDEVRAVGHSSMFVMDALTRPVRKHWSTAVVEHSYASVDSDREMTSSPPSPIWMEGSPALVVDERYPGWRPSMGLERTAFYNLVDPCFRSFLYRARFARVDRLDQAVYEYLHHPRNVPFTQMALQSFRQSSFVKVYQDVLSTAAESHTDVNEFLSRDTSTYFIRSRWFTSLITGQNIDCVREDADCEFDHNALVSGLTGFG